MASVLDTGWRAPGTSPCRGHYVVFMNKILYSYGAFFYLGVR